MNLRRNRKEELDDAQRPLPFPGKN